ncbi:hypothetical protein Nepgr_024618 [Nepenthes gracilis]|uniref:Uncharacterized protein n=1 Tax=Nepenthes gracilis TaxID=150966 RepID=A0AAD3T3M5_NEPGR|nr:hypothetical protein Nepgr_024618 [Nepenthes gracilis]
MGGDYMFQVIVAKANDIVCGALFLPLNLLLLEVRRSLDWLSLDYVDHSYCDLISWRERLWSFFICCARALARVLDEPSEVASPD